MSNYSADVDRFFVAQHIAEPFVSITKEELHLLDYYFFDLHYDVVGCRNEGQIIGYFDQGKWQHEQDFSRTFSEFNISEIITQHTPLMECLKLLKERPRLFVMGTSGVQSIITQSDIQKSAVRMLFFGVITQFESELATIIEKKHPHLKWTQLLKPERVEGAIRIYEHLIERNQELELIHCTQFCDKTEVLLKDDDLFNTYISLSKNKADRLFDRAEKLRNDLAHAQPLNRWIEERDVIGLIDEIQHITKNVMRS